jgi:adenylate cyclase, class 2
MDQLEIEIKFHLPRIGPVRRRIMALDGRSTGRHFESNIIFDDDTGRLRRGRYLLRLRQDNRNRLTFKSPAPDAAGEVKIRRETEVTLDDFGAMRHIVHALGFQRETVYEKWRETFELEGAHLCLDTLPFADFLEIEGDIETIRDLAGRLGLNWNKRIRLNYHALFEMVKRREGLTFTDITFANFKGHHIDFTPCLPDAEAG